MVGAALEAQDDEDEAVAQSDIDNEDDETALAHTNDQNEEEGRRMTRNVFEEQSGGKKEEHVLSHDAIKGIVADAQEAAR